MGRSIDPEGGLAEDRLDAVLVTGALGSGQMGRHASAAPTSTRACVTPRLRRSDAIARA